MKPHVKITYEELFHQNNKLLAENKHLRLRPSMHGPDAKVIEFINIKNQLALATLKASNIEHAVEISVSYLLKIPNIHAVAFFKDCQINNKIDVIAEKGLPKNFIRALTSQNQHELKKIICTNKTKAYYSKEIKSNTEKNFQYLKKFDTLVVMPIANEADENISILLASMKEFKENDFFKFLYESVLAQLKSSFLRIILYHKLKAQSLELEKGIKFRTAKLERMNKELVLQISTHKKREQQISEELDLFKSIINQHDDLVLRINTEGQISYTNPKFPKFKAIQDGDNRNLLNYLGEGDFPGLQLIMLDFEKGAQIVRCNIQLLNDSLKWFSFHFSPVKNKRGLLTDIQVVARNIDKNMKEQHELQLQKDMLNRMLNSSNKILFCFNNEGKISLASNTFTLKTGIQISDKPEINIFNTIKTAKLASIKSFLKEKPKRKNVSKIFDIQFLNKKKAWEDCQIKITKVRHTITHLNYNIGVINIDE